MKIITKRKQQEIDEINIKKLTFAMRTIYEELSSDEYGLTEYKDFRKQAEGIYYSDNIIMNGYESPKCNSYIKDGKVKNCSCGNCFK